MRKGNASPADTIRRVGVRVSRGPWSLYVAPGFRKAGRLIVALGRSAGGAVTRSRIRRIARDVFGSSCITGQNVDVLLLAREDVGLEPRRHVRRILHGLMERGRDALAKRHPSGIEMGG